MTRSAEIIAISKINKILPKNLTHQREEAKIKFIKAAVNLHRTVDSFGKIDFDKSYWNGSDVHISYTDTESRIHICDIVSQVMVQKFFSNFSRNENVFFYRFLNIFRSLTSGDEWLQVQAHLSTHNNSTLRENVNQYIDYRKKLAKIEQVLSINQIPA